MPWCDTCQRQLEPHDLGAHGECPTCSGTVAAPKNAKIPWHFWVLVVAAAAYTGWRGLQGAIWVVERLL